MMSPLAPESQGDHRRSAAFGADPLCAAAATRAESRLPAGEQSADKSKGALAPIEPPQNAAEQLRTLPELVEVIDPGAKAMFDAAVDAVGRLKSVQLKIGLRITDEGAPANPTHEKSGSVVLQFSSERDGRFPMSRARLEDRSTAGVHRLAYDGKSVLAVDGASKTFTLFDESTGLPKLASDELMPMWFLTARVVANSPADSPAAFRLIAARIGAEETLDGERCDVLTIARRLEPEQGSMVLQQRIALARSDRLPRRLESWARVPRGDGTVAVYLRVEDYTALRVDATIADDVFSTAVPEGHVRSSGTSGGTRPAAAEGSSPRRTAEFERARAEFLMAYAEQQADEARVDAELAWLANAGPQLGDAELEVGSAGQPDPEIERRYQAAEIRFRAAGATEADIRDARRSQRAREVESEREPEPPPALGVGDPAPPLEVEAFIKGARVDRFEKGRIYVIQLWATWAAPAVQTIPLMTEIQTKFKEKVTVVGVSVLEPAEGEKLKRFVASNSSRIGYSIAHDGKAARTEEAYLNAAKIKGIPAAFVVDGAGRIAFAGHPNDAGFRSTVEALVDGKFDMEAAKAAARRK
jgi:hypothetical protein